MERTSTKELPTAAGSWMKGSWRQRYFISEPKVSLASGGKELRAGKAGSQAWWPPLHWLRVPNVGFLFPQILVPVSKPLQGTRRAGLVLSTPHATLPETQWDRVIASWATDSFLPLCFLFQQQKISFGIWWRKTQIKDTHVSRQLGTHGKEDLPLERWRTWRLPRADVLLAVAGSESQGWWLHLPPASGLSSLPKPTLALSLSLRMQSSKCAYDKCAKESDSFFTAWNVFRITFIEGNCPSNHEAGSLFLEFITQ